MADRQNQDDLRTIIEKLRQVRGDVAVELVYGDEDPCKSRTAKNSDQTLDWMIEELEHKSEEK